MLTTKKGRSLSALAVTAVLALAVFGAPVSGQVPTKALECNSDIEIMIIGDVAVPGGRECDVQLRLSNGLSRDIIDNPVSQTFQQVQFFPSCTTTPCVPDPAQPVTFVSGSQSTTCPGMAVVTPNAASPFDVLFDFSPAGITLGPPSSVSGFPPMATCNPGDSCECFISFRVFVSDAVIAAAAPSPAGPFPIEALLLNGVCDITGLTSSASGTNSITKAPTLGAATLAVLMLVVLCGAAWMLRGRQPLGEAV